MSQPSPLRSMTGYATAETEIAGRAIGIDIKSVNGRGRDIKMRLPSGFESLETDIRNRITAACHRGSVQISLRAKGGSDEDRFEVDWDFILQVIGEARARRIPGYAEDPDIAGFLQMRGAVRQVSGEGDDRPDETSRTSFLAALDEVIAAWNGARTEEGAALGTILSGLLDQLARDTGSAAALAGDIPTVLHKKWQARLSDLQVDVSPERLAQELALLAVKADVTEEIERLHLHIHTARDLLARGAPCGRQLDFLTQELMREANTLCSKSSDATLTTLGLSLKQTIDQFREQVQNVE